MTRYAQNTDVSSSTSRSEIERSITRYGAHGFMYGWSDLSAVVAFEMENRRIKFSLPLPSRDSKEFTQTETGRTRRQGAIDAAREQAVNQRWRALALVIKAKLEAVETGITTFDEEFMAHIVLPNGKTVGDVMVGQITDAYESGQMPPLLTGPT
jgi:hypothetical protein